jgi:hypothetical protein
MRKCDEGKMKARARASQRCSLLRKMVVRLVRLAFPPSREEQFISERQKKVGEIEFPLRKRFPERESGEQEQPEDYLCVFLPLASVASCITAIYERARVAKASKPHKGERNRESSPESSHKEATIEATLKPKLIFLFVFILFFGFSIHFPTESHVDRVKTRDRNSRKSKLKFFRFFVCFFFLLFCS